MRSDRPTPGHDPREIIARGIAQPWSDHARQAGSIIGDLRAAGYEIVPRARSQGLEEALDAAEAVITWHDADRIEPGLVDDEDRIAAVERYCKSRAALVSLGLPDEEGRDASYDVGHTPGINDREDLRLRERHRFSESGGA